MEPSRFSRARAEEPQSTPGFLAARSTIRSVRSSALVSAHKDWQSDWRNILPLATHHRAPPGVLSAIVLLTVVESLLHCFTESASCRQCGGLRAITAASRIRLSLAAARECRDRR